MRLFDELLRESGLQAELRHEGTLRAGLAACREARPDVLVVDLGLPDSEGPETVGRCLAAGLDVPVMVFTGHTHLDVALEALDAGASDYLEKDELTPRHLARTLAWTARERRRERRFRALVAELSDVISVVSRDGTILYESPSVERVLGYPPESMLGDDILEFIHPKDREWVAHRLARIGTEPGAEIVGEARFRHADGRWRVLEARARVPREETGIEGVVIVTRDVTEARRVEHRLRESEGRFRQMAESIEEVFYLAEWTDEARRILYASPAYETIWGRPVEELYEDPRAWMDAIHEEDRERVSCRVDLAAGGAVDVEYRIRRPDGEVRWIRDQRFAIRDLQGTPSGRVAGVARDITETKRYEAELAHRSLHDALTDLPNRGLFEDRLRHAVERTARRGGGLAVLAIDLKRFKAVNDALGHGAGDRLLREVAARLVASVREQDTVARIGGDEFVVLLEDVTEESVALDIAGRMARDLNRPVELDGDDLTVEVAIGIAVHGDPHTSPAPAEAWELVRWAEHAMHRAKRMPGTQVAVADPTDRTPSGHRLQRETRLRKALADGSVRTVYQPIYGIRSGELLGVEALARWDDPELGPVSPADFIPLAEETGLIVELGEQQLEASCEKLLDAALVPPGTDGPLRLHVNLSARQVEDPGIVDRVGAILARTAFPAERLCLEITESAAMEKPEIVDRLKEIGVQLAVDDFGTRYSTLAQLRRLRLDALKIDRTFVAGLPGSPEDRAIVCTILTLGHSLGLRVVAEGIETSDQRDLLSELGCPEGQGFLLGRPMEEADLVELVRRSAPEG